MCNVARNYQDVQDSWQSVATIIAFYGQYQHMFAGVAGPGFWNDPDMVTIIYYIGRPSWGGALISVCQVRGQGHPEVTGTKVRSYCGTGGGVCKN